MLLNLEMFMKLLVTLGLKYKLVVGFSFFLKGKLLGRGGTRKKKLLYRFQQFTTTTRSIRYNYKQFVLRTSGGVIGGQFNLFF